MTQPEKFLRSAKNLPLFASFIRSSIHRLLHLSYLESGSFHYLICFYSQLEEEAVNVRDCSGVIPEALTVPMHVRPHGEAFGLGPSRRMRRRILSREIASATNSAPKHMSSCSSYQAASWLLIAQPLEVALRNPTSLSKQTQCSALIMAWLSREHEPDDQ